MCVCVGILLSFFGVRLLLAFIIFCGHRMFAIRYSPLHLLELVAYHCQLSYHSYVREVCGDGSVLGGVELEIAVVQEGAKSTRFFFWSAWSSCSRCPYEESALQAVCFLQSLYGFVVHDFNYNGMQAYRNLARSAVVLAVSVVRPSGPVSRVGLDSVSEPACRQMICNHLISSVCNM